MGFFSLYGSATALLYGSATALATTLTLAIAINGIGIGFQRGTHTRWQLVANDGTCAPALTDMRAPFAVAVGGVFTLFIAASPNAASVWARAANEVTLTSRSRVSWVRPACALASCQNASPIKSAARSAVGKGTRRLPSRVKRGAPHSFSDPLR